MKFNVGKFRKNFAFFAISTCVVIVLLLFSNLTENTLEETELSDADINVSKLVINEIMTSNKSSYVDSYGNLYDYVEIYNGSENNINLKGYGLGDEANKIKYTFPDIEIESKGYVVVFLSGNSLDEMHASFKLKNAGGETLTLFKPNGKVIDAVETVALKKDTVMARDENGSWVIQLSPTPGYDNNISGREEFVGSLKTTEETKIVINEILPDNDGIFRTKMYNEYSGYIELKNTSDETVDLSTYSLSNSLDGLYKYTLPDMKLGSGDVVVIFTSNRNAVDSEIHASFKLTSGSGVVVLTNGGLIEDQVEYDNIADGQAYIKTSNGFAQSNAISPGYENNNDGIKSFQKEYLTVPSDLIINEVMNNNYEYLAQNGGEYYDWIELYNNSNKTIKLSDYCLTDSLNSACKYKLPNVELKSGEYYIVMASGNSDLSNDSYEHANFKISDTEGIYITKKSKVIDSILIANTPSGYSYGRSGDYGFYYFSKPSPGKKNSSGTMSVAFNVSVDKPAGVYNDVENVTVALSGGNKIYYTLDGSTPTKSSKVYSSPLTLEKTTVLKTRSIEDGMEYGEVSTYSYIINENHNINVISLSIDPKDLKSLHSNAWKESYMKQSYVEYFDEDGNGFSIGAGLKLFGGSTRGHAKKSYEVKFKKEYGDANLEYKVFKNVNSSVYNSLVLRSGSQDEMGTASQKTLIRDIVGTSLVNEYTDVDVQDYVPVAMYINGSYWGLYYIREKVDESFVGNHYNVKATSNNTNIIRIDNQVKSGSISSYNKLISFVSSNDMSKSENYEKVKEQIDIESYCDYWIAENWTTNNDIVNCRFFSNPDVDDGKWHYIFYDLDFAFYNVDKDYYSFFTSTSGMTVNGYSTVLLRNLMKNDEFKKTFLERLAYNLKNTWKEENVINKIDSVIEEITEDEIKRNLERWDMSYSTWKSSVEKLKTYAKNRQKYILKTTKSYFNLSNSEYEKYFGDL